MNQKIVAITPPGAIVDNTAFTTSSIDLKGWNRADVFVHFGAMDIAMAALSLSESDDDTSYAAVTGANFSGSTMTNGSAGALPPATADNLFYAFRVDARKRKRYIDLQATGGDGTLGTYMTAFAILSRGKELPNAMGERGLTGEIAV
jgi:hypothetical protein